MRIYLAGPISGLSYDEVVNRIEEITEQLSHHIILSPMTGKEYLRTELSLKSHDYSNPISTNHAIFNRDMWMVEQSDIVFADLTLGKDRVSIGTVMELAWASILRKHIIVIMNDKNIHYHAFVIEAADIIFDNLNDALIYLKKL